MASSSPVLMTPEEFSAAKAKESAAPLLMSDEEFSAAKAQESPGPLLMTPEEFTAAQGQPPQRQRTDQPFPVDEQEAFRERAGEMSVFEPGGLGMKIQATSIDPEANPVARTIARGVSQAGGAMARLVARPFVEDETLQRGQQFEQRAATAAQELNAQQLSPGVAYAADMGANAIGSLVQAGVAAPLGPWGMIGLFASSEANDAYTRAKAAGKSDKDALVVAASSGTIEATPAAIMQLVGLPGLEGVLPQLFRGTRGAVAKGFKQAMKTMGIRTVQEIPEEIVTEIGHRWNEAFQGMALDASPAEYLKVARDTTVATAMTMGLASSPSVAMGAAQSGRASLDARRVAGDLSRELGREPVLAEFAPPPPDTAQAAAQEDPVSRLMAMRQDKGAPLTTAEVKAVVGGTRENVKALRDQVNQIVPAPLRDQSGGDLGALSARYESSGDPATVSTGKGDPGGVSYGLYQFASNKRTPQRFVAWGQKQGAPWAAELKGLKPGSPEFFAKWREISERNPEEFAAAQHAFTKEKYYDVAVNMLRERGIDIAGMPKAVHDAVWSMAVQHGPGATKDGRGATALVEQAYRNLAKSPDDPIAPSSLISEMYRLRRERYTMASIQARFKAEERDALAALSGEPTGRQNVPRGTQPQREEVIADERQVQGQREGRQGEVAPPPAPVAAEVMQAAPAKERNRQRIVYSEQGVEFADRILSGQAPTSGLGGSSGLWVSDNPDLAIGQGENKGVRFVFDAANLDLQKQGRKPGSAIAEGSEFTAEPQYKRPFTDVFNSIQSVTVPADLNTLPGRSPYKKRLRWAIENRLKDFQRTDNGDGTITYTRPSQTPEHPSSSPLTGSRPLTPSTAETPMQRVSQDIGTAAEILGQPTSIPGELPQPAKNMGELTPAAVNAAAAETKSFGDMAFISDLHQRVAPDMPADQFKQQLVDMHRKGEIELNRADMTEDFYAPGKVSASEARYLNSQFHFVRAPQQQQQPVAARQPVSEATQAPSPRAEATQPPRTRDDILADIDKLDARIQKAKTDKAKDRLTKQQEKLWGEIDRLESGGTKGSPPAPAISGIGADIVAAVEEGVRGIAEILGGGRLGITPQQFSEDSYRRAVPHFQKSWESWKQAGRGAQEFVDYYVGRIGEGIRPYAERFIQDVETNTAQTPLKPIGRPELANPGETTAARELITEVDELRKTAGTPERQSDEQVRAEADVLLQAPDELYDAVLEAGETGKQLSAPETNAAKRLVSQEAAKAMQSGDAAQMQRAVTIADAYRRTGTAQGRGLRQRFDPLMSPEERAREALGEAMMLPPKQTAKRKKAIEDKIDDPATPERQKKPLRDKLETIQKAEAKRLEKLRQELIDVGIDVSDLDGILKDKYKTAEIMRELAARQSTTHAALFEAWISFILSGPHTQVVNITGNAVNMAWEFTGQRLTEASLNLFANDPDSARFGEFFEIARALGPGLKRAGQNGLAAWHTERPIFEDEVRGTETHKFELPKTAISGKKGRVIRVPLRGLTAMDEMFLSLTGQMQVGAVAYRQAVAQGLTGAERRAYIEQTVGDLNSPAWAEAMDRGLELTFRKELSSFGQGVQKFRNEHPALQWFLPFVRTPANLVKTGLRKSPFGLINIGVRAAKGDTTKAEFLRLAAEQVVALAGTSMLIAALGFGDDEEPWITGTNPYQVTTRGERDLAYRTIPPMTIRFGDRRLSYQRIDPFATTLASTVDSIELIKKARNGEEASKLIGEFWASMVAQTTDKTFFRGISDLIEFVSDPTSATKWASNFASSWVPNLIRQPARATDTKLRETGDWGEGWEGVVRLGNRVRYQALPIPGNAPPPRVDIWGRDIDTATGFPATTDFLYRLFSPMRMYSDPEEGVAKDVDRMILNWNNQHPNDTFAPQSPNPYIEHNKKTVYLSDEQYYEYRRESGELALRDLGSVTERLDLESPTKAMINRVDLALRRGRAAARKRALARMKAEGLLNPAT